MFFLSFFKIYVLFINLFNLFLAALGLSCGMQDLHCGAQASLQLWCVGFCSLVVAHRLQSTWALQFAARGLQLPCGTWDLSSLTRDRTLIPCIVRRILYHWTTREVPVNILIKYILILSFITLITIYFHMCISSTFKNKP